MKERLKSILDLGITDSDDLVELHKQRMFNLFAIMVIPFIIFTLILNVYNGRYELGFINFIQLSIFIITIWIGYHKKYRFLRTWILVIISLIALYVAFKFRNGTEYRILVMMVAGAVIFDSNWKYIFFTLFISVGFSYCRYLDFIATGMPDNLIGLRVAQVFIPFVLANISLLYLKNIYLKSQLKLQTALEEVSLSNNSKERILYSLAHDLRSPLSNVISISKIMKQQGNLTSEQLKWLDFIESSSQNSNALVNELLQSNELLSKPENFELIDLCKLIEDVILMAELKSKEKGIVFEFKKMEETCILDLEQFKIQRLFANLMNNAIKFSNQSGKIIVSVSKQGQNCRVSVKDFGIGIAEKNIPYIFDAFTKAKRKGTQNEVSYGLGLSICKQIAEQHGGSIHVESELGKGTEFVVSLPMVRA
jgi:signal transduction histidine kinase